MDDNPAGLRWINWIGLTNTNDKRSRDRYNVELRLRGYYKQPSSGTMRICIRANAYITNICAIAELRKTKVIDSITEEANEIIITKIKNYKRKKARKFLCEYWGYVEEVFYLLRLKRFPWPCGLSLG